MADKTRAHHLKYSSSNPNHHPERSNYSLQYSFHATEHYASLESYHFNLESQKLMAFTNISRRIQYAFKKKFCNLDWFWVFSICSDWIVSKQEIFWATLIRCLNVWFTANFSMTAINWISWTLWKPSELCSLISSSLFRYPWLVISEDFMLLVITSTFGTPSKMRRSLSTQIFQSELFQ